MATEHDQCADPFVRASPTIRGPLFPCHLRHNLYVRSDLWRQLWLMAG